MSGLSGLLLALSCSGGGGPDPAPVDSAGWPQLDQQPPQALTPQWTAEEAGQALQAALEGPYPDVRHLGAVYMEWIARGDETCPGGVELQPPAVTLEGCTASSGVHYAGLSTWADESDTWGLRMADFRITDPEGGELLAGGEAILHDWGSASTLRMKGTFVERGAEGWLGSEGSMAIELNGGSSGVTGELSLSTEHGAVYIDSLLLNQDCLGAEPWLRGPEGGWYRFDLGCSCGPVAFDGVELGEICLDPEPIAAALEEVL